jgi:hypothetical protein
MSSSEPACKPRAILPKPTWRWLRSLATSLGCVVLLRVTWRPLGVHATKARMWWASRRQLKLVSEGRNFYQGEILAQHGQGQWRQHPWGGVQFLKASLWLPLVLIGALDENPMTWSRFGCHPCFLRVTFLKALTLETWLLRSLLFLSLWSAVMVMCLTNGESNAIGVMCLLDLALCSSNLTSRVSSYLLVWQLSLTNDKVTLWFTPVTRMDSKTTSLMVWLILLPLVGISMLLLSLPVSSRGLHFRSCFH